MAAPVQMPGLALFFGHPARLYFDGDDGTAFRVYDVQFANVNTITELIAKPPPEWQ